MSCLLSVDVVHPLVDDDHAAPVRPEVVGQVAVADVEAAPGAAAAVLVIVL